MQCCSTRNFKKKVQKLIDSEGTRTLNLRTSDPIKLTESEMISSVHTSESEAHTHFRRQNQVEGDEASSEYRMSASSVEIHMAISTVPLALHQQEKPPPRNMSP